MVWPKGIGRADWMAIHWVEQMGTMSGWYWAAYLVAGMASLTGYTMGRRRVEYLVDWTAPLRVGRTDEMWAVWTADPREF